jgi:hypothetical protein
MASSNLRKTASLLRALMHYTAPRGDNKIRVRIGAPLPVLLRQKARTWSHRFFMERRLIW